MLFFDLNDRTAGIAAFMAMFVEMQSRYKDRPEFVDEQPMTPEDIKEHATKQWDTSDELEREAMIHIWHSLGLAPDSYYEAHITINPQNIAVEPLENIATKFMWHFSAINGDEVLGKGVKWYLTRSLKDAQTLFNDMKALCFALNEAKIPYIRRKIEHIVFDERRDQIAGTAKAA